MTLLAPIWLLLGVPLGAALVAWPLPNRGLNILRAITLGLLVLAMAQPAVRLADRHGVLVVVADRSASMPARAKEDQLEAIKQLHNEMGSGDRLAVVSFGREAGIELAPGVDRLDDFTGKVDGQHSRLAHALDRALALIPPGKGGRILVLSDGHWTGSDPAATAARVAGRGIAIDHRWMSRARGTDLAIRDLQAPGDVLPGQAFMISGWVISPRAQEIAYELRRHDLVIAAGKREVPQGLSRLLFRDRPSLPGTAAYSLTIRAIGDGANAADAIPENNTARALVGVRGRKPLLLVSNFGAQSGLARLLVKGGATLVARTPAQCNWSLEEMSRWSAVILENVMAGDLGLDGMEALRDWVRETGSGLMMTGGEKSYAPGGYYQSPIEPILPVTLERRNEIRKLQTAIVVVMDRSGSMGMGVSGGKTKMDLANLGAAQVLDLLSPTDEFGVIAVDSAPNIELRLDTAERNQTPFFRRKILSIQPGGGGIYVYVALEAAAKMLQRAKAANKHVILFSDAQDSEEPGDYKNLVAKMRKAGITISVIGLGTDKDVDADLLKDIAKLGEGNVYFTDRPTEIPRIFAQDTFAVARNTFIKEATAVKILTDFSTLGAQGQWAPPALGGYNLTYARKRASVGMQTQDEYTAPGVAWWQVGAGRVVCFTGEADGTYAGDFAQWDDAGDFYATLARWAAGSPTELPDNMLLTQEVRDGVCVVQLHLDPARTGRLTERPRLTTLRGLPGEAPQKTSGHLNWKTADLLEATLPLQGGETLLSSVDLGQNLVQTLAPVCLPYSPEFAPDHPNRGRLTLAGLSHASNGQARLALADIWDTLPRQPRHLPLAVWLVLAALILFLLEVFQRRTGFFGPKLRAATPHEGVLAGPTQKRTRTTLASAATESEEETTLQLPKRKRTPKHLDQGPPVVAPPVLGETEDPTKPPIIAPPQASTLDALQAARQRAKDREGRQRED
jgi:uncharacterized membrane protein